MFALKDGSIINKHKPVKDVNRIVQNVQIKINVLLVVQDLKKNHNKLKLKYFNNLTILELFKFSMKLKRKIAQDV